MKLLQLNNGTDHQPLTPLEVRQSLTALAEGVHRRRLVAPAIFFLEMYKPLLGVANALVIFSQPLVASLLGSQRIEQTIQLLSARENIEDFVRLLEEYRGRGSAA